MNLPDNKSKTHDAYCVCTQSSGLFVPNRHLSHVVAAAIVGLFFVFLAGFFCGKQHEIKHFLYSVDDDSFSDQISSALYGVSLADLADFEAIESPESAGSGDADAQEIVPVVTSDSTSDNSDNSGDNAVSDTNSDSSNTGYEASEEGDSQDGELDGAKQVGDRQVCNKNHEAGKQYYAQLIGFGTSQAADSFARRLTKQGFSVKVEQCKSRTAKGKMVTWYQVVTQPYSDVQKLQDVVDVLAHTEKLKGVRVKAC